MSVVQVSVATVALGGSLVLLPRLWAALKSWSRVGMERAGEGRVDPHDFSDITSQKALRLLGVRDDGQELRKEVGGLLAKLIQNEVVNSGDGTAQELRSISHIAEYLSAHGITSHTHCRPGKPNRPNLIAHIEGGYGPRVMLGPSHVDVVPVSGSDGSSQPEGWQHPPFSGHEEDGVIFGRGAVDMLGPLTCQLVAFVRVKQAVERGDLRLRGTLLFCAVSDEEAGSEDGVKWLLRDAPASVRELFRADVCLTELGGATIPDRMGRGTKQFFMSNSEKGCAEVLVKCKGRGGHGSIPANASNALEMASHAALALSSYSPPLELTEEWRSFVRALDIPAALKWALSNRVTLPAVVKLLLSKGNPLGPIAHALTRMTISPNHVTGSVKTNVVPEAATLHVDVRTLPGQSESYIHQHVEAALKRRGGDRGPLACVEVEVIHFTPATRSPVVGNDDGGPDPGKESPPPVWRALSEAAVEVVPGATLVPVMLPGGTDCRFYREAGAAAFGANLLEPAITFGEMMARFHGTNERISVRALWTSLQFYTLVAHQLLVQEGQ